MALQDIVGLKVGDAVKLGNTHISSDMTIKIGDRKKFKCVPGRIGNRLSVQIGETLEDIPDELLGSTRSEEEV